MFIKKLGSVAKLYDICLQITGAVIFYLPLVSLSLDTVTGSAPARNAENMIASAPWVVTRGI